MSNLNKTVLGSTSLTLKRAEVEIEENWEKLCKNIPSIELIDGFSIKMLPPFGGAMVRFQVQLETASVSVYLDTHDRLGYHLSPYWEVYPGVDGEDADRYEMKDTDLLWHGIKLSLSNQLKNKTKPVILTIKNSILAEYGE